MNLELAGLMFPEGVLDYFTLTEFKEEEGKIHFYLEEKNILPSDYSSSQAVSKGFLNPIVIEDFPLRGKDVLLHIKRRRWTLKETGTIIQRDWTLAAQGIKMTADFAAFLKGISGYSSSEYF